MTRRKLASAVVLAVVTVFCLVAAIGKQAKATIPGGTNILHVPMSWCIVNGSPAAVAPNILSEGATTPDTTTNAVIWRRHERPTDNVFLPQASISLRSSINNAWGTLSFPIIADPSTTLGLQGDVDSSTNEATTLINNCDSTYASAPLNRAGIGITAININLWDDAAGNHTNQVGLGGCGYIVGESTCSFGFFIIVADNHYLYPTVPNRMIPGDGTWLADPLDLTVGHETGHALNLPHRSNTTALMNPSLWDNNGDGRVDNTTLNASEVTTARGSANRVPGLEVDPDGEFTPGPILEMRRIDGRQEHAPPHVDLAALSLMLDTKADRPHLVQRLWGLLPCKTLRPTTYAYLADLDNKRTTGASAEDLAQLGVRSAFEGADLVAQATIVGSKRPGRDYRTCQTSRKAWIIKQGNVQPLPPSTFDARIATMRAWRQFGPIKKPRPLPRPLAMDLFNIIDFSARNSVLPFKVRVNVPVRLSALVIARGKPIERFGKSAQGARFILQRPQFPHCFPLGVGHPGGTAKIRFNGLLPNREIHALLGPLEVLRGVTTDANGRGVIQLPIPRQTRKGNHLVTIGHDALALTADCTLTVR